MGIILDKRQKIALGKTDEICPLGINRSTYTGNDEYYIFFTGKSRAAFYLNRSRVEFGEDTIIFVSPNCLVELDEANPAIDVLIFSSAFYTKSAKDAVFLQNTMLFPRANYRFYTVSEPLQDYVYYVLDMLYGAYYKIDETIYESLVHNLLEQLLIQCTVHGTVGRVTPAPDNGNQVLVSLFRELAIKDIRTERSVKHYADKLNISQKRLAEATQDVLGKTPKKALTEFVINQFKWQLLYTEQSIKEIALEYGFLDTNNFSAFFTKEVGMTPTEYRKTSTTETIT